MPRYHLPHFLETLARYDIEPRQFYKALEEYSNLAIELVLEEEPQLEPVAFLRLSDEKDAVQGFMDLFIQQSPHLMFKQEGEEEDDDEAF